MSSQAFSQLITLNLQYNGNKTMKQCPDVHCVESVHFWVGLSSRKWVYLGQSQPKTEETYTKKSSYIFSKNLALNKLLILS